MWPQEAEKWSNGRYQMRVVASRMDFQQHCVLMGVIQLRRSCREAMGHCWICALGMTRWVEFSAHVEGEL